MTPKDPPHGFTMVELLTAITIIGIATSLATPAFRRSIERVRVRSALDRLVGELYRVRMTAVAEGGAVQLFLEADGEGCTRTLRFQRAVGEGSPIISRSELELPGLCLRHTGDSIVGFNGRGMLRPPTRSFFISHGLTTDSVVISIAGRVRRSYRRRRRREKVSASGNNFRPQFWSNSAKSLQNKEICAGTDITTASLTAPKCAGEEPPTKADPKPGFSGSIRLEVATTLSRLPGGADNPRERPSVGSPGFSLIEILVAMVILSVGIMGLQTVAMGAVRSVAEADRQTRNAARASESLEAALYQLRTGSVPSQLCATLPPFGDQLSRRISIAGRLATVTVAVTHGRSPRPSPSRSIEISSFIFVPGALIPTAPGAPCS